MNSIFSKLLVILLMGSSLFCSGSYKEEILKLARFDLLPQFQEGIKVKQISSYDTTGGNDDGFSGKYSYLRKEGDNLVIADLKGSGIIQRIWTPTPTNDTIQFFFDGETTPRIGLPFIDLFSGEQYPFIKPVVGNEVGGYYCYLPIPYKNSCKIVYKGKRMQFIQIQYNEMTEGTSASFPFKFSNDENEALSSVAEVWTKAGTDILSIVTGLGTVKSSVKNIFLKPGETASIFKLENGGRIIGLKINSQQELNTGFKDLIIRAKWDDESVAAINCPLADFFGYAFGKPSAQSLLVGVKDGTHYCYMPMPFDSKANLELEFIKNPLNKSTEIPISVTVYYTETKRATNEGKFYAEWKRQINPEMGKPYRILEKSGQGHYVGTMLQAQGLNSGMTLFFEGDDICVVDGELRLHGTGSEDYFNGGWYAMPDRWDQAFSLPLHGCLAYSIPLAHTGGYRFFMTDKISFEQNISLSIEHGGENNKVPVDYTSVAFYYCNTPPVSNDLPSVDLLGKIDSPKILEYWIQLLTVKALSSGASVSNENCRDVKSGRNYEVLKLVAGNEGFVKFELDVPADGEYKFSMSYFKGPACGQVEVNQRQVPVMDWVDCYASENTFIEKEFVGNLFIKDGTNTITVALKENLKNPGPKEFLLHRIYLEKVQLQN